MIKKICILTLVVASLVGCTQCILVRSEYYDITGQVLAPKAGTQDIPIYTGKIDRPYQVIGAVKVLAQKGTTQEAVNEEFKRRARLAGADALTDVRYGEDTSNDVRLCGKVFTSKRNMSASATAIIFTDNK